MIDLADIAASMARAFAGQGEGAPLREPWGAALLRGDYRHGWSLYESRFTRRLDRTAYAASRWRGEPLAGRALTVIEDAALGDSLLLARAYAPLAEQARAEGSALSVVTSPPLVRLWQATFPGIDANARRDALMDPAQPWVTAASLPGILGPTPEALPACPYLHAAPTDNAAWRERLRLRADVLNVGLCWASGQRADDPRPRIAGRTIPLGELAPLGHVEGMRWFGLQVGVRADNPAPAGMEIERIGAGFRDFGDTAAVASLLDLVITVDTSSANLVGAMGLASWVLLPKPADWRWGLADTSTPWFPTLRLFRQQHPGDWSDPVARVADELGRLVAARGAA